MTFIKRLILTLLTVLAVVKVGLSLIESWNEPQIQSRLELYQTNLILHAAEWQGENIDGNVSTKTKSVDARKAIVGEAPFKTAANQYEEALKSDQKTLEKLRSQLQQSQSLPVIKPKEGEQDLSLPSIRKSISDEPKGLKASITQIEKLVNELDLRLGLIRVEQSQIEGAVKTWNDLTVRDRASENSDALVKISRVLASLWSNPPRLLPNSEQIIKNNLDGWFRYRALSRLYELEQRQSALSELQKQEQQIAEQAVFKLAIVGTIPALGCVVGIGILIFLGIQLIIKKIRNAPPEIADAKTDGVPVIAQNANTPWLTPWNAETVWQVLILGFFFVGQFLLPLFFGLLFGLLKFNPAYLDIRARALFVLISYLLMALGGLGVLYLSLKPFFPLPKGWFRFKLGGNWFLWGLGGYFTAIPLVILVSLINQKLWQGQGGSNPILSLTLEGRDGVALFIFGLTASVAAPLFEEFIFRGFLLPSLTRYLSVGGAIAVSSLLFAIAHLSLSEVLPLATLGMVLGVVYTRSRNLLAPMLLHSLWNSGTLLSLFILGSGVS